MGLKDWLNRLAQFLVPEETAAVEEPAEEPEPQRAVTAGDSFAQRAQAAGVPQEVQDVFKRGLHLLAHVRWDEAAQTFASFLIACPRMAADAHAGLARAARHLKGAAELSLPELLAQDLTPAQVERARGHYAAGVAEQPDHPHCCAGLAQMLGPEETARRRELLEAACRVRPAYGVLTALGDACLEAGRPHDAIAAYERALASTTDRSREVLKRLILVYEDLGKSAEAKRWRRELSRPRPPYRRLWFEQADAKPIPAAADESGCVRCPNCQASFSLNSPADWSGKRHLAWGQRLQVTGTKPPVHPVWCVTANVIGEHPHGEAGVMRSGTRLFRPGTKVYCFPAMWGDGYEQIVVIGLHRKSREFITCVVSWKHLTNWRAKLAYHPHVVDQFRRHRSWDDSAGSKATAEEIAQMMRERESRLRSLAGT